MKILGIDPGLTATGYGCVAPRGRGWERVFAGVVAPDASLPLPQRLAALRRRTAEVVRALAPASVAVEELFAHPRHPGTAIAMAQARGVILEACADAGVVVEEYAARRVKQAVAGMQSGFRLAHADMARRQQRMLGGFASSLRGTVAGLRKAFADDLAGAHRVWAGAAPGTMAGRTRRGGKWFAGENA